VTIPQALPNIAPQPEKNLPPNRSGNEAADDQGGCRHRALIPKTVRSATNKARILIVDVDDAMRRQLVDYLGDHGLNVSCVAAKQDLSPAMSRVEPDLVLLDVSAQERNSLRRLRDLRSRSDVPVIVTTSLAGDEVDRIVALELGADDYLERPFSLRELLARIRAKLRRWQIARIAARRRPERGGFRFAGWELHRRTRQLIAPSGQIVPTTKGEYALLVALLSAPQRPLSREQLLQATRVHEDVFDRSIDVQILRLRRKLEIDPAAPSFIRTERGVGYAFAITVEAF
jgi:two-component system, OmpR family, response regulator